MLECQAPALTPSAAMAQVPAAAVIDKLLGNPDIVELVSAFLSKHELLALLIALPLWQETELDLGRLQLDIKGAGLIARTIKHMGQLSIFTFRGNEEEGVFVHGPSRPIVMYTSVMGADFSSKDLGVSGAIMLSAFLPKCM